jgi:hypothetical protein
MPQVEYPPRACGLSNAPLSHGPIKKSGEHLFPFSDHDAVISRLPPEKQKQIAHQHEKA